MEFTQWELDLLIEVCQQKRDSMVNGTYEQTRVIELGVKLERARFIRFDIVPSAFLY